MELCTLMLMLSKYYFLFLLFYYFSVVFLNIPLFLSNSTRPMLMLYFQDFVKVLKLFIRNSLNMELGSLHFFF